MILSFNCILGKFDLFLASYAVGVRCDAVAWIAGMVGGVHKRAHIICFEETVAGTDGSSR